MEGVAGSHVDDVAGDADDVASDAASRIHGVGGEEEGEEGA